MNYSKNSKLTGKRGNGKRALKKISSVSRVIPSAPANFTVVKLHYVDNIALSSTLGANSSYIFRINDVNDPNLTSTGHQPYYRDQMFGLYSYARVIWASIKVTLVADTALTPMYALLSPIPLGNVDSDMQTASERKGSKECYLNGGTVIPTLRCATSSDFYFGSRKGTTLIDAGYSQPASSSSTIGAGNAMYYEIMMKTLNSGSASVYVKVDIEQIVRFEEPIQQTGS